MPSPTPGGVPSRRFCKKFNRPVSNCNDGEGQALACPTPGSTRGGRHWFIPYFATRIGAYLLVMFIGLTAIFILPRLMPTSPAETNLMQVQQQSGNQLSPEDVATIRSSSCRFIWSRREFVFAVRWFSQAECSRWTSAFRSQPTHARASEFI